ncbi:MAG: ribosome maturation factor RimM [Anaerolineales bacterium]
MNPDSEHNHNTGSSSADEPVFVVVGKFRKPHGIRGEIRMSVLTDYPELISPGKMVYVGPQNQAYTIKDLRWHGGDLLLSLEELPDRTAVEVFRNVMVSMKSSDIPVLPEGEYYLHQLVGMEVVTDQGEALGKLAEILITGANDVYLVRTPAGKELLLPAIDEVIREIDLELGLIRAHLIAGLLD